MQNYRKRKIVGMAIVEQSLANVVAQLTLAQSATMPLAIGLANELTEVLSTISELHKRVANARYEAARGRGSDDVDA